MPKMLENKPVPETKPVAVEAFEKKMPEADKEFAAFGEMDIEQESSVVGVVTTTRFNFDTIGDRLFGFLIGRKKINMPDEPIVYEVHNIEGDFAFFGSELVNNRMAGISDHVFLDITYIEDKISMKRRQRYKEYRIRYLIPPTGFDSQKYRVGLDNTGKKVKFYDAPTIENAPPAKF